MPQNDAAFCAWVLRQLYNTERYHMVEQFYNLASGLLDMNTVYQRLQDGSFADAAEFEEKLVSVPTEFLKEYPILTRQHEKASAFLLDLPGLFKQRNRWENQRRRNQQRQQQQQQQAPVVPSTSAYSAPVTVAASALDHDTATDVALDTSSQPRFKTPLTIRTSATPGPSRLAKSVRVPTTTRHYVKHALVRREPPVVRILVQAPRELVQRLTNTSIGMYPSRS
jgi:hypothetical protein